MLDKEPIKSNDFEHRFPPTITRTKSNHYSAGTWLGLLEEDTSPADNGATVKAKLFYRSCMNTSELRVTWNKNVHFDQLFYVLYLG